MAGDDLLVGTGIDLSGLRRDTPKVLAHFRALGTDITRALSGRGLIPDLSGQGREAAQGLARGLSTALASELRTGLTDSTAVLRSFADTASSQIRLADLTPEGERAGRTLVLGLRRGVQRDAIALRDDVRGALAPTGLLSAFTPAIAAARSAASDITLALGSGGVTAGRALADGLAGGLVAANAGITAFARTAGSTLAQADLLGGLAQQGERAGGLLVSGVTASISASGAAVQRAVTQALIPTNLAGEMARVVGAAGADAGARLITSLSTTGTNAGRALVDSLSAALAAGTSATVAAFTRNASGTIDAAKLLGDATPIGERAGVQLLTGVRRAVTAESGAIRAAIGAALVPQDLTGQLGGLRTTITAALGQFPALFVATGQASGQGLVSGIASQLGFGSALLTTFAQETSRALTGALAIGDVSGSGNIAGRQLATAIASGIAAEAPRIQAATTAALLPADLTAGMARIVSGVVSEATQLAPQLGTQGTVSGRALIQGMEAEVAKGAGVFRQLAAGAQIGVVVDPAPIRATTAAMADLRAATEGAATAARGADVALNAIDADGAREAAQETRSLADAQREWLREAEAGSVAAQGMWARQRNDVAQIRAEGERNAARAKRDAQQEIDARKQVRAELTHDITGLAKYGATVDGTSRRARQAWIAEAAAIKNQAREVGLSRAEMARLDGIVDEVTRSFIEQSRAAKLAANEIRNAGTAAPRFGSSVIDLGGIRKSADTARRSLFAVTTEAGKLTAFGSRLGPALVGVSFGLEALARGGEGAAGGLRTALRAVASFATFFGPKGFIVAGAAAASAAIIDLFSKSRDEMAATTKAFDDSINQMVKNADTLGLQKELRDIEIGVPTRAADGTVEISRGLTLVRREYELAKDARDAAIRSGNLLAVQENANVRRLAKELAPLQARYESLDRTIRTLQSPARDPAFSRPITITAKADTKGASDSLDKLAEDVRTVIGLAELANDQKIAIPELSTTAGQVYDRLAAAVAKFGDGNTAAALKVRQLMAQLRELDAVAIELTRRQLVPGIEGDLTRELPPLEVRAIISSVDIQTVPEITVSANFDPTQLSLGFKNALKAATAAQTDVDLSALIGDRKKIADASENAAIATANLRREVASLAGIIRTSALSDADKASALAAIKKAAEEAGISLESLGLSADNGVRDTRSLIDAINNVAGTARGVLSVADAFDAIGDSARQQLTAVIGFAEATANLIEATGKGATEGGVAGAIIAAGASTAGLIASIISGPMQEAKANRDIQRKNIETMERLRQDLAGQGDATIKNNLAAADAIRDSSILQQRALTSGFSRGFKNVEALDKELRASGSSLAILKRRAEELGIEIVDAKGRITASGLAALEEASRLAAEALARFEDTVADFEFLADARTDIFDIEGPQASFDNAIAVLQKFTSGLGANLTGIDISTKAGRDRAEAEIRRLYDLASKNLIPKELLNGLTAEEFVNQLVAADNALDTFAETANAASSEMVNVVQGFRDFNLDRAKFLAQEPKIRTVTPIADLEKLGTIITDAQVNTADRDLAVIAQAIRESGPATEIDRLSESITTLAERLKVLGTSGVTLSETSTGTARTTQTRTPAPAAPTTPTVIYQLNGDINFTQPVQNPEQMTDAIKSVFVMRARASSNPEVKRVVNHLP